MIPEENASLKYINAISITEVVSILFFEVGEGMVVFASILQNCYFHFDRLSHIFAIKTKQNIKKGYYICI